MSAAQVHVVDLSACPGEDACAASLDQVECSRLARFATAELRRRFATRRWALRMLLAAARGIAVERVELIAEPSGLRRWRDGGGPRFSTAHRGDTALIAIAQAEIGVDVEDPRALTAPPPTELFAIEERAWLAAHPGTVDFLRLWTAKEAYLKARGVGLAEPLDASALVPSTDGCDLQRVSDGDRAWIIAALKPGDGLVASCCRRPDDALDLIERGRTAAVLGVDAARPQR